MSGAIDLHVDTLSRLLTAGGSFQGAREDLAIDLPRARAGEVAAICGACFVADVQEEPRAEVRKMLALLDQLDADSEVALEKVTSPAELEVLSADRLGVIPTIENARSLEGSVETLEEFAAAGVAFLGVTWNGANELATGCRVDETTGLTAFGREAIQRAAALGLAIDISHLNRAGVAEVLRLDVPMLATHSNARALHEHTRNLDDDQLEALREGDGLVGLNLYPPFLGAPPVTLATFVDHARHIADRLGVERIALGSDLDGIDETPESFTDYRDLPALRVALRSGGFSTEEIDGMFGGNFRRWWRKQRGEG